MTEYAREQLRKRTRRGKLLTLILLVYGLAVTLIYFFFASGEELSWVIWLAPFTIASVPISYYFDPALLFVPLAVLALIAWLLLHKGKLFGREILIGCMIVYLTGSLFFTPFYLLLASASWQGEILKTMFGLSLCGIIYPILVLIFLHWWNPRNK